MSKSKPYDGLKYERRFFGKQALFNPIQLKVFLEGRGHYKSLRNCICDVMAEQDRINWNPSSPKTAISRYFFEKVQLSLRKQYQKSLRLYCAIGSNLDYFHGIDGFFWLNGAYYTFDIKISQKAKVKTTVDLVLCKQAELYRFFRDVAPVVAEKLQRRIPQ